MGTVMWTLILLVFIQTLRVDTFGVGNLGYTLTRLVERHAREEKVVVILQQRLLVLKEMATHKITRRLRGFHNSKWQLKKRHVSIKPRDWMQKWKLRVPFQPVADVIIVHKSRARAQVPKKYKGKVSHDLHLYFCDWMTLQDMYLMKPEILVSGLTVDTSSGGVLNSLQCSEIAVFQGHNAHYSTSIEWVEMAATAANTEMNQMQNGRIMHISQDLLRALYLLLVQQHNLAGSQPTRHLDIFVEPVRSSVFPVGGNRRVWLRQFHYDKHKEQGSFPTSWDQFMHLCLKSHQRQASKNFQFKCYLDRKRNPYFLINPLKVEQFSKYPPIYQFYDVVGNQTIQHLLHLRAATIYKGAPNCGLKEKCGYSDLKAKKHFVFSQMITGLQFSACPYHCAVTESTPGRFSRQHSDHTGNQSEDKKVEDMVDIYGDCVATLLYYLETPVFGGETVFLSADLIIPPVRGSALFWFNMFRDGQLREDVAHGGCPVVHGEKIGKNQQLKVCSQLGLANVFSGIAILPIQH